MARAFSIGHSAPLRSRLDRGPTKKGRCALIAVLHQPKGVKTLRTDRRRPLTGRCASRQCIRARGHDRHLIPHSWGWLQLQPISSLLGQKFSGCDGRALCWGHCPTAVVFSGFEEISRLRSARNDSGFDGRGRIGASPAHDEKCTCGLSQRDCLRLHGPSRTENVGQGARLIQQRILSSASAPFSPWFWGGM